MFGLKVSVLMMIIAICIGDAGQGKLEINSKIIGGYPVTIDEVPFQVSVRLRLLYEEQFGLGHMCGGALISQRLVCSAAHCYIIKGSNPPLYKSSESYVVVAGSTYIDMPERYTQAYLVEQIIGHKHFNATTMENDIALLFLNSFIPWEKSTVRAILLPQMPPKAGDSCIVSGWGRLSATDQSFVLHQARVPIMSNVVCRAIFGYVPLSQMCAGFLLGGTDACRGDSGSPLHCSGLLAGIVSWGVGCAEPVLPGVYTNISSYIYWITKHNSTLNYSHYEKMGQIRMRMGTNGMAIPSNLLLIFSIVFIASKD